MADKISLLIDGDDYWVEGGDFDDILEAVKAIPGRAYDRFEKTWTVAGSPQRIARILVPLRLMNVDDDPVGDSTPIQIHP